MTGLSMGFAGAVSDRSRARTNKKSPGQSQSLTGAFRQTRSITRSCGNREAVCTLAGILGASPYILAGFFQDGLLLLSFRLFVLAVTRLPKVVSIRAVLVPQSRHGPAFRLLSLGVVAGHPRVLPPTGDL